jgi:hypothetical protein
MGRFVRPETCTLWLANGESITVKKRLSNGEQRAAFARMYMPGPDGQLTVNPLETGIALVAAYLVDWSFRDDDLQPVPIRELSADELTGVLDQLTPEAFAEVRSAIDVHIAAMTAAREAEKNGKGGAMGLPAISPSPSAAAGVWTGSETLT